MVKLDKVKISICFVLIFILALSACEEAIHLELPEYEEELVLYGVLIAGEKPEIWLSESIGYFKPLNYRNGMKVIEDAQVILNDGTQTYTLYYKDHLIYYEYDSLSFDGQSTTVGSFTGGYTNELIIEEGKTYNVEVKHQGKMVRGQTTVPRKINLTNITREIELYETDISSDEDKTCWKDNLIVNFDDPIGENYYKINWDVEVWIYHLCEDTFILGDSCLVNKSNFILPIINDNSFNSMNYSYNLGYFRYGCGNIPDDNRSESGTFLINKAVLHNVSKGLYDFNTSLDKQSDTELNPFTEPSTIKSNIEGGLGVFASMSEASDTLELRAN